MDRIDVEAEPGGQNRIPAVYWLLGIGLVAYVALCTGNRDSIWGADAWEHLSALKALSERLWCPGHPLYATDEPSVRYSPYLVLWATFSRATGLDPYRTLGLAAVVNTALLVLGVGAFLKGLGQGASAAAALPILVGLWGGVPGHSSSYALSDLPWHQVNPSAFTFTIVLFFWALFKRFEREGWRDASVPLMVGLAGMMLIDHVLTACLGMFGLWLFALAGEPGQRRRLIACVLLIGVGAACLALAWPWYSFLKMATTKLPEGESVVNPGVTLLVLSRWAVPAMVGSLCALTVRRDRVVRLLLLGGYAGYLVGLIAYLLPEKVPATAVFQRLPLPGLIFPHLALGIFAHRVGLFRPRTWPGRLAALVRGDEGADLPQAVIETVFAITLGYFLLPQIGGILKEPYLARPYVAPLLGREDKQLRLKSRFEQFLEPVGERDVILSDPRTMWVIPSSKGRMVYSAHGQLLVADEEDRLKDIRAFLDPETTDSERIGIIQHYDVKWIVLNRETFDRSLFDALLVDRAVVRRDGDLVLMSADSWVRAKRLDAAR